MKFTIAIVSLFATAQAADMFGYGYDMQPCAQTCHDQKKGPNESFCQTWVRNSKYKSNELEWCVRQKCAGAVPDQTGCEAWPLQGYVNAMGAACGKCPCK
ncbi:hypothetical protein HIM_01305 [Hirsutella minnesotensis 3608]|nr:hypothetical protein HIM_01305 [Hirsutella minnesotensis 3608]